MGISFFVLAILSVIVMPSRVHASENGGTTCAGCTLIVGLLQQAAAINNRTLVEEADVVCSFFSDGTIDTICQDIMNLFIPLIAPIIEYAKTADVACNLIGLCKNETAVCRLFPPPSQITEAGYLDFVDSLRPRVIRKFKADFDLMEYICKRSDKLCRLLIGMSATPLPHLPTFDADQDRFSTYAELRGYDWRGLDCNDNDSSVFPGRDTSDEAVDQNCNGIVGVDPTTQKSFEDEWCRGTQPMGVAALGDSATAHFRIPETYLTAANWSKATFAHVVRLLENEGDWPMLSWSSGFLNATQFYPDVEGPMTSIYTYMKELNECNAQDYQNIGVNGADSKNFAEWATLLARNASVSAVKPLLLFFSMIGNDVCGSTHDFSRMTTPEQFYTNVYNGLVAADALVPKGTKVVLVPLVDGRVLYDTMSQRIHPIGKTYNDVTYATFYNYLNCLDVSPCWGWMNGNVTVRNTTWLHADALNQQLPKIVNSTQGQFTNINVFYPGNIIDKALVNPPVPRWTLIEPVDGFHPSQTGNSYFAQEYWKVLSNISAIIPPANPFNQAIINKFGKNR